MVDLDRNLEQYRGSWIPLLTPFSEKSEILHKFLHSQIELLQSYPHISTLVFFSPLGEGNLISWQEKAMILHSMQTRTIPLRKVIYIDELTEIEKLHQLGIQHPRDYDSLLLDLKGNLNDSLDQTITRLILSFLENHIPLFIEIHGFQSSLINFFQNHRTNPDLYGFLLDESISTSEISRLAELFPRKMLISKQESAHLINLQHGVHAIFSPLTNIYPSLVNNFIDAFHHNNLASLTFYHSIMTELNTLIESYSYLHAIKYIWYLFGFPLIESRDQRKRLTEHEKSRLKDLIAKFRKKYHSVNL